MVIREAYKQCCIEGPALYFNIYFFNDGYKMGSFG